VGGWVGGLSSRAEVYYSYPTSPCASLPRCLLLVAVFQVTAIERAKIELAKGKTLDLIATELGVPRPSLSGWIKDMPNLLQKLSAARGKRKLTTAKRVRSSNSGRTSAHPALEEEVARLVLDRIDQGVKVSPYPLP
jgi:hypothetical protein